MGDELPQQLPEGFDVLAPGPAWALVVVATIDRSRLCGSGAVSLLASRARQVAYERAQLLADMAGVARTDWHSGSDTLVRTGRMRRPSPGCDLDTLCRHSPPWTVDSGRRKRKGHDEHSVRPGCAEPATAL